VKKGGTVEQEIKPIPSLCLASPGIWRWSRLFYFEKSARLVKVLSILKNGRFDKWKLP
jgi:hypothetical protein